MWSVLWNSFSCTLTDESKSVLRANEQINRYIHHAFTPSTQLHFLFINQNCESNYKMILPLFCTINYLLNLIVWIGNIHIHGHPQVKYCVNCVKCHQYLFIHSGGVGTD